MAGLTWRALSQTYKKTASSIMLSVQAPWELHDSFTVQVADTGGVLWAQENLAPLLFIEQ